MTILLDMTKEEFDALRKEIKFIEGLFPTHHFERKAPYLYGLNKDLIQVHHMKFIDKAELQAFTLKMARKLARKGEEGFFGWSDLGNPGVGQEIIDRFVVNLDKSDEENYVDLANLIMMMNYRGIKTADLKRAILETYAPKQPELPDSPGINQLIGTMQDFERADRELNDPPIYDQLFPPSGVARCVQIELDKAKRPELDIGDKGKILEKAARNMAELAKLGSEGNEIDPIIDQVLNKLNAMIYVELFALSDEYHNLVNRIKDSWDSSIG